jgi:hypothetical protein
MTDQNPWQVLVHIWRNAILAFVRMPFLILTCFLFYTLLSAYWFHYVPFQISHGFVEQAGYDLLHAVVFAPLILGVMIMATEGNARSAEIWSTAAVSVGIVIALRELAIQGSALPLHMETLLLAEILIRSGMAHSLAGLIYALPGVLLQLGVFLLSVRLILLLPILGLEKPDWKVAVSQAWLSMKGRYGFALAVSFAAVLPMLVGDHVLTKLYRGLRPAVYFSGRLPLSEWEALMVRSAELSLDYIVLAALAVGLYQAIRSRPVNAPSIMAGSPFLERR